jgi:hypothetical protein
MPALAVNASEPARRHDCPRTYSRGVSDLEDPDYDAWEAASHVSPEELEEQLRRDPMLGGGKWQLWKGRIVEDTPPLESYEPRDRSNEG